MKNKSLDNNPLSDIEYNLYAKYNINSICGIDEAGRGPVAGPLVVCAVEFKKSDVIKFHKLFYTFRNNDVKGVIGEDREWFSLMSKINDSKKLSEKNRLLLSKFLKMNVRFHIEIISNNKIDQWGISKATLSGFNECYIKLNSDMVITDFFSITSLPKDKQVNLTKGDTKSISVAAASILAKTTRDNIMKEYAKNYPQYEFEKHKGYGTKRHIELIKNYGYCPIHRKTYKLT